MQAPLENSLQSVGIIEARIRKSLTEKSDKARAIEGKRFFKEPVRLIGVAVPECRKTSSEIWNEFEPGKGEAIQLAERLLGGKNSWEAGVVALTLLYKTRQEWGLDMFGVFSSWLLEKGLISNWAHCDEFSNHSIGFLAEKFPNEAGRFLHALSESENRWARRASIVSLVIPAKKGKLERLIFSISEKVLLDKDDLVQKGVGWTLKELAKKRKKDVIAFLLARKTSRLVCRIAFEKFPPKERHRLVEMKFSIPGKSKGNVKRVSEKAI